MNFITERFSFIGLLAFAISCHAAQATASAQRQHPAVQPGGVRVGKHQLGESFKKWLAISEIDLEEICPSDDHSDARCAQLLPIEDSGQGEAKEDSQEPLVTWLFKDGKLGKYSLEYADSDMRQHLAFLIHVYGTPADRQFISYENGFGATWKRLKVWCSPLTAGESFLRSPKNWKTPESSRSNLCRVSI
jgi:hypothetical protein